MDSAIAAIAVAQQFFAAEGNVGDQGELVLQSNDSEVREVCMIKSSTTFALAAILTAPLILF